MKIFWFRKKLEIGCTYMVTYHSSIRKLRTPTHLDHSLNRVDCQHQDLLSHARSWSSLSWKVWNGRIQWKDLITSTRQARTPKKLKCIHFIPIQAHVIWSAAIVTAKRTYTSYRYNSKWFTTSRPQSDHARRISAEGDWTAQFTNYQLWMLFVYYHHLSNTFVWQTTSCLRASVIGNLAIKDITPVRNLSGSHMDFMHISRMNNNIMQFEMAGTSLHGSLWPGRIKHTLRKQPEAGPTMQNLGKHLERSLIEKQRTVSSLKSKMLPNYGEFRQTNRNKKV